MNDIEAQERTKYEQMWQIDSYRRNAPGEKLVGDAVSKLGIKTGDTVIDFGCGTGRAAAKFQALGMKISAVDIAANCLDSGIELPLAVQTLWEPCPFAAKYGFCTDTMEHIPPERVDEVLANIKICVSACYFQIATRPDSMGKLIEDTLHLTVNDADWWLRKLQDHFGSVEIEPRPGCVIAVCKS